MRSLREKTGALNLEKSLGRTEARGRVQTEGFPHLRFLLYCSPPDVVFLVLLSMSRDEPGNQVAISKVEILILHLEKAGSSPARDKRGMLASRKRKGKEDGHDRLVAE